MIVESKSYIIFIHVPFDINILFLFLVSNFTFYGLNEIEVAKCTKWSISIHGLVRIIYSVVKMSKDFFYIEHEDAFRLKGIDLRHEPDLSICQRFFSA